MAEFLNGRQAIRPEEVSMRNPKTLLIAVALLFVAVTAWAGDDAVVNKPKSAKDKGTVVPARPAEESGGQNHGTQTSPTQDQAPQPRREAVPRSQSSPAAVEAPTSPQSTESGPIVAPATRSQPGPGVEIQHRRRGGPGGPGPGGRPPHGGRPPRGGWQWRGHDHWPYSHYHGSWNFLWHFGPVIYPVPVYVPHVVRIPRTRIGVYVRQTGDDYVGTMFANSVRDRLREQGLRVVYSPDDARLELYLVSIDENPDEAGYWSAVSVSYVWYPGNKFITAQMLEVGLDQVDDLAKSVANYADDLVDQYR